MSANVPDPPRLLTGASIPPGVRDLEAPPECLFLTGSLPPGPRVAIVGTRRPTPDAHRFALELAFDLAAAGVVVVSGGAVGIDTAAHEGALRAGAGTLVVAPASYCRPYPEENRDLFRAIVEGGGGYLTTFDSPTRAQRHAFFARNALLVSLCVTVILVQAPFRSGARNAVSWARELGRPYWVVPHAPWCSQGSSSVTELRLGGMPLSNASDVLGWLSERDLVPIPLEIPAREQNVRPLAAPSGAPGDEAARALVRRSNETVRSEPTQRDSSGTHRDVCRLVALLADGPKHPDELCARLGWESAHLQVTVLHATLLGEVRCNDAGQLTACLRG